MNGHASSSSFRVGFGTEDLVLRPEEPALYTRTSKRPAPFLDKIAFWKKGSANVWRLPLEAGRITGKEPILQTDTPRSILGSDAIEHKPLGLYLHPDQNSENLYALNASKKSPGYFRIPLQSDDLPIHYVSAGPEFREDFGKANSIAVHPDGSVFVSIFRPFSAGKGDEQPVFSRADADSLGASVSLLACYPGASEKWQPALWNVTGANGMAFWSPKAGQVDFFLADYNRKKVLRFNASEARKLELSDTFDIPFHPDNLAISGESLLVAGQYGTLSTTLNVIASAHFPTRSGIALLNLRQPNAKPALTPVQPPFGPAVATAVLYRDVIFCSYITGSEIRSFQVSGLSGA